ncbi:calcium-binding EF hand family protein [Actinidia rufa]|uniref:Calcium-binding EF hand family protein n=1 Tax=Actinidia rufa TaxID=165716 RepID=A0A7J0EPB6_9ERIC|nr:calcium-binding EF hand family protein [Actinidia rufa]
MDMYRAIVKMGQDGKADGVQVTTDQIQSELEELVKSLNERCKSYGLRAKPTTLVELPFGWQPGIQGGAADWDESWDKFEDEGFTFVKELTLNVQNVIALPKPKSSSIVRKASSTKEGVDSSTNGDHQSETLSSRGERVPGDAHNEEGVARSPPESPAHASESPSNKSKNSPSRKNFNADGSSHAIDTQSEHGAADSVVSGDKSFYEQSWGCAFDTNYDTNSGWDFGSGPIKPYFAREHMGLCVVEVACQDEKLLGQFKEGQREMDYNKHSERSFFDTGDLGLPPIRTDMYQRKSPFAFGDSVPSTPLFDSGNSPQADNTFQKKSTYAFDSVPSTPYADNLFQSQNIYTFDSVPSTPHADNLFQSKNTYEFDSVPSSPQADSLFQQKSAFAFDSVLSTPITANSECSQGRFQTKNSFARFDSFRNTAESEISQGFFQPRDYGRFDSFHSTKDSDDTRGFQSFDDMDPFGSSRLF